MNIEAETTSVFFFSLYVCFPLVAFSFLPCKADFFNFAFRQHSRFTSFVTGLKTSGSDLLIKTLLSMVSNFLFVQCQYNF